MIAYTGALHCAETARPEWPTMLSHCLGSAWGEQSGSEAEEPQGLAALEDSKLKALLSKFFLEWRSKMGTYLNAT